ncbi:MAG: tripartite tricarboxylate transporter TctB family protein [Bacillota bacterium]
MARLVGNLLFLSALSVFAAIYRHDVQRLPRPQERIVVEFLFVIIMVLVALEAIRTLFQLISKHYPKEKTSDPPVTPEPQWYHWFLGKQFMLMLTSSLFLFLVPLLGFFLVSFLFLVLLNWYLGSRKVLEYVVFPVGFLCFIYGFFVLFLQVKLPKGILF